MPAESYSNLDTSTQSEVANFNKFTTIDWPEERVKEAKEKKRPLLSTTDLENPDLRTHHEYVNRSVWTSMHRYFNHMFRQNWTTFLTLTAMGITIGCIAGFIQIFTESLVSWKSGYCSKNWLLNKNFCCSEAKEFESQCVAEGFWINYSNGGLKFIVFVILSIVYAIISAVMVKFVAPMAAGSGISEIKVTVAGFIYNTDFYSLSTLLIKSLALPLTIASGLSVGKEGPSVHYATCCGFIIAKFFLQKGRQHLNKWSSTSSSLSQYGVNFPELSEYMVAGAAGGVAVAFGSPIGGVLFALEDIASSSDYNLSTLWKSYYVTMMGIATLKAINPFRNGKIVQFEITYDKDWHIAEIPIFLLLGVFGGVYGIIISKLNVYMVHFRKKYLSSYALQEVLILTVLTSLISYFNQFLQLDMAESMEILFHECIGEDDATWDHQLCSVSSASPFKFVQMCSSLLFATIVRAALIIVSYNCKVPCGIFVPSMAVGATFGRFISILVEKFITGPNVITAGTYAFLGAAASLSGITHLTLSVVVIMFELTGAFFYIIPTMIVVAVTRMIFANYGTGMGIAEQMIVFNGFPHLEEKYDHHLSVDYSAQDIMCSKLQTLPEHISIRDLKMVLSSSVQDKVHGFPVITIANKCIGYVKRDNLETFLYMNNIDDLTIDFNRATLGENEQQVDQLENVENDFLMDKSVIVVKSTMKITLIHDIFKKVGPKVVMVENENGDLTGLITRKDLMSFESSKHKELNGALYTFNESWDDFLWSIITKIKAKLGRS